MSRLDTFPRFPLAFLPTPLHEAPNLSRALGGARIFVKRDDLTGLAFGGNKTRKLEFLVADALAKGANVLITTGAAQSNHCRQTAAAARKAGLRCVLVLTPSRHEEFQGNILLDALLKCDVVRCADADRDVTLAQVAEDERARGNRPYVIGLGGSNGIGALGYAAMMREFSAQLQALAISPSALYFSSGSAGTHAGLWLGQRLFGPELALIGVSPNRDAARVSADVVAVARDGARLLGESWQPQPSDFTVVDGFTGPGYGISTPASLEAVRLFAEHEGLFIDPVYTAKAAAAMFADLRTGRWPKEQTIVFLHTGGTPALFAYAAEYAAGS